MISFSLTPILAVLLDVLPEADVTTTVPPEDTSLWLSLGLFVLTILTSYIIGSIPFAYIVAKQWAGIDIREHGSGNVGATNVARVVGKRAGQLTLLLDFLKGAVPIWLCEYWLLPGWMWLHVLMAVGLLIGHSRSIFLGFSGGKSAATGLGSITGLNPIAGIAVGLTALGGSYLTRYVSVGSMLASVLCPFYMYLAGAPFPYVVFGIISGVYVILRHRANIQRLLQGTENRL